MSGRPDKQERETQAAVVSCQLSRLSPLTAQERTALASELARGYLECHAGEDIVREGASGGTVHALLKGWMYAYKSLDDGRRQITRILLPGDIWGLDWHHLDLVPCSISSVTPCAYSLVDRQRLDQLMQDSAGLSRALARALAVSHATQQDWLLSLGRRTALERICYLLCEICTRLQLVGLLDGQICDFPMTQIELADATGLSIVHVNRVLQEMRNEGLISLKSRQVQIHKVQRLKEIAGYMPIED